MSLSTAVEYAVEARSFRRPEEIAWQKGLQQGQVAVYTRMPTESTSLLWGTLCTSLSEILKLDRGSRALVLYPDIVCTLFSDTCAAAAQTLFQLLSEHTDLETLHMVSVDPAALGIALKPECLQTVPGFEMEGWSFVPSTVGSLARQSGYKLLGSTVLKQQDRIYSPLAQPSTHPLAAKLVVLHFSRMAHTCVHGCY